jgi:hypothetical protein
MKNKKQYIKNMIFTLPFNQAKFVLDNIDDLDVNSIIKHTR